MLAFISIHPKSMMPNIRRSSRGATRANSTTAAPRWSRPRPRRVPISTPSPKWPRAVGGTDPFREVPPKCAQFPRCRNKYRDFSHVHKVKPSAAHFRSTGGLRVPLLHRPSPSWPRLSPRTGTLTAGGQQMTGSTTAATNRALGAYGEALAARHLVHEQGMVLLDRNWRCEAGEIDL